MIRPLVSGPLNECFVSDYSFNSNLASISGIHSSQICLAFCNRTLPPAAAFLLKAARVYEIKASTSPSFRSPPFALIHSVVSIMCSHTCQEILPIKLETWHDRGYFVPSPRRGGSRRRKRIQGRRKRMRERKYRRRRKKKEKEGEEGDERRRRRR